jgi:hypothetical protein
MNELKLLTEHAVGEYNEMVHRRRQKSHLGKLMPFFMKMGHYIQRQG